MRVALFLVVWLPGLMVLGAIASMLPNWIDNLVVFSSAPLTILWFEYCRRKQP
jgi:hypothetical protein